MADTFSLSGGNAANNKFYDYYNQIKTNLMTNPNTITADTINVKEQTMGGLAEEISAYLRPFTQKAISERQQQTGTNRAEADVDAASRGMTGSTWLSDAKNRMAAAEAYDIAGLESDFAGELGSQVYSGYQQYLQNKQTADTQNVANKLAADKFNAQLYATLEQLAYERAGQQYALNPAVNTVIKYLDDGITVAGIPVAGGGYTLKPNTSYTELQ